MLSFPASPNPAKPTSNGTHRNSASQSGPAGSDAGLARLLLAQELGGESDARSLTAAAEALDAECVRSLNDTAQIPFTSVTEALELTRPT